ncbi:RNA-directed DNA polymerase, eukaryota [Tanacetum coccineum]|uniref:RNA-directed DNA polymerase, eukaryota n=1 Tax=Tanacetum coccineum TaxID=301880 RepID=A0ABQ5FA14_9ASTR
MENLRRNFFNGAQEEDRKIAWVKWHTVLAAKQFGGLGVSSFFALNRGLLAKWVWRFLSQDNSLWYQVISTIHGSGSSPLAVAYPSNWSTIIKEFNSLKEQETNKDISVADKLHPSLSFSWRRSVRGGIESQQFNHLSSLLDYVSLSNSEDRWVCDLSGDGVFRVKDVRNLLDEFFLPKSNVLTRWVKFIPNKVNIFAWKLFLNRLPTRSNLAKRKVSIDTDVCPVCDSAQEEVAHVFFCCSLARDLTSLICRWWNLDEHLFSSYVEWLSWFNSLRLGSKLKAILEGVFYITWWSVWNFRNHLLFASTKPRKESIFDDIVLRSFSWCVARGDETTSGKPQRCGGEESDEAVWTNLSWINNDSPSLPENESFHVPSSLRSPAKPPDDDEIEPNTGVLTVKVVGDISEHYVLMPRLLPTQPTLCPVIDTLLPFSSENKDKDCSDFEASRARGFVLRSLELQILSFNMGIQYPNLID